MQMIETVQAAGYFGRDCEIELLNKMMADCLGGRGSVALISGERGIGKTSLVERMKARFEAAGALFLSGGTLQDSAHPFVLFSHALPNWNGIFRDTEHTSFSQIFAVNHSGLLMAHASSGTDDMDPDIMAGMLSAVQNFVQDSFNMSSEPEKSLGKLEYGDMKILIEHGENLFLTGVLSGAEHRDMGPLLKRTLERIEREHGGMISGWSGRVDEMKPVVEAINQLSSERFLVKRDLEGMKLSNERVKIAGAVLHMLAAKASEKPVVMILEDLQWADGSSLFVLDYLARNIADIPVFIACTMRPGENQALDEMIAGMTQEGIATGISLEGLDRDAVCELISGLCSPNDFPDDFVREISGRCSGNPLFIIETVRQMMEDGHISFLDSAFSAVGGGWTIPDSVEDIVQKRLDTLEPGAMMLCECASCMGRVFETDAVLSLDFLAEREESFARAQAMGVVFRGDRVSEFAHAIYPEVIYRDIGAKWKTAYHRSLGRYFEGAHADNTEPVIYELAKHFSRCGDAGKAAVYCVKAGEKAEAVFAAHDAAEFYKTAVGALKRLQGEDAMVIETLERLGDIHILTGKSKEAEEAFREALSGGPDGDTGARLHRKCSISLMKRGDFQGATAEAEQGMEGAGAKERQRLEIQIASICMMTGDFDTAIEKAGRILDSLSNSGGSETELGNCHNLIATSQWYKSNVREALEHHERALEFRTAAGDIRRIAITLNNIGVVHHASGDLEKAMKYYEDSMAMWEKAGDVDGMSGSYGNIGIIRWNMGELDAALKLFHKARRISESIGDRPGMVTAYGNISMTLKDMGELDASMDYGKKSLDIALTMGDKVSLARARANMANQYVEAGNPEGSWEHFTEAETLLREVGATDMLAEILLAHATALSETGKDDESNAMLSEAQGMMKDGGGTLFLARGRMHLSAGDYGPALEMFGKALEIFRAGDMRSVPELVCYRAGALEGLERDGEAAASYREALEMFERMGMRARAKKCAESLKALESRITASP